MDRERNLARYSTKGAGLAGKGVLLLIKKLMVFVGVPIFTMGIFLLVLTAGVERDIFYDSCTFKPKKQHIGRSCTR